LDGDNVAVQMMHTEYEFDYACGDRYQAVDLLYAGY